jgi:murein DD-endopeptidase MepM/ murein hydrolase activator NlpD
LNRRRFAVGLIAAGAAVPAFGQSHTDLGLTGRLTQGGCVVGRTRPGALIFVDGEALTVAGATGRFFIGFDRDCGTSSVIEARQGAWRASETVSIAPGDFPSQSISGLPPSTVDPSDPALLARIQNEAVLKAEAYASRSPTEDFADGFDWPLATFRVTSGWGSQRILNGTPARPHYGIDLAAPAGTDIRAPAPALVALAHPAMHYEGGITFLDHGQGVITVYLHQSRLLVETGQRVERGQVIGRVGATGRATGPHLCWRARWRDRNFDPSTFVGGPTI